MSKSTEKLVVKDNKIEIDNQTDSGFLSGFISGEQSDYIDSSEQIVVAEHQHPAASEPRAHQDDANKEDMRIFDSGVEVTLSHSFQELNIKPIAGQNQLDKEIKLKQKAQKTPWEIYYQQNQEGDTQLHIAVIHEMREVVYALVKMALHPCLLDIQNDIAQTPLHLAVLTSQPFVLRKLVVAGASLGIRDRSGNTALHLACSAGDVECVKQLLTPLTLSEASQRPNNAKLFKQQDLEQWNYDGEKCVHLATKANQIEIIKHLVKYGADINAREGKSGCTPLHIAIEQKNDILANFILEGCPTLDMETMTYGGLTAYQLAAGTKYQIMVDCLSKRGAEPLSPPDSDYDDSEEEDDFPTLDHYLLHHFENSGTAKMNVVN